MFEFDVLRCERCGGRMRVIAFIQQTLVARRILEHLGLPAIAPPLLPARAPPSPSVDHQLGHLELFIDPEPDYTTN